MTGIQDREQISERTHIEVTDRTGTAPLGTVYRVLVTISDLPAEGADARPPRQDVDDELALALGRLIESHRARPSVETSPLHGQLTRYLEVFYRQNRAGPRGNWIVQIPIYLYRRHESEPSADPSIRLRVDQVEVDDPAALPQCHASPVGLVPQESSNTCWAASMAMLLRTLQIAPVPQNARDVARLADTRGAGIQFQVAYSQDWAVTTVYSSIRDLIRAWEPPLVVQMNYSRPSAQDWRTLLARVGPVVVISSSFNLSGGGTNMHAAIVTGLSAGTEMLNIVDPAPVGQGSCYNLPVSDLEVLIPAVIHSNR